MASARIVVHAEWDPEAAVFVATSKDVPGLVAEAATLQALQDKLDVLVPELLELNAPSSSGEGKFREVPLIVKSKRVSKLRIHA